jgi:hypothetical protein
VNPALVECSADWFVAHFSKLCPVFCAMLQAGLAGEDKHGTVPLRHFPHYGSANVASVLCNDAVSRSIAGPDVGKVSARDYISRWAAILRAVPSQSARKWAIMTMVTGVMAQIKFICQDHKKLERYDFGLRWICTTMLAHVIRGCIKSSWRAP